MHLPSLAVESILAIYMKSELLTVYQGHTVAISSSILSTINVNLL